jgi:hypothetical protein
MGVSQRVAQTAGVAVCGFSCSRREDMRIPLEVLQCLVYIGKHEDYQDVFRGTGFLLAVNETEGSDTFSFTYLITANHVAKKVEGNAFLIRVNMRDGSARTLQVDYSPDEEVKWYRHPTDETADVAVTYLKPEDFAGSDLKRIPDSLILPRGAAPAHAIGPGDEVYITGLFTHHMGKSKNSPIVRVGNIAMLPVDRVVVDGLGEVEGYLIEARSIGGLSGSPVFVHPTVNLHGNFKWGTNIPAVAMAMSEELYLLGLVCGHYDVDLHTVGGVPIDGAKSKDNVNVGVGIVIPSYKILEIIQGDVLKQMRSAQKKKALQLKAAK